MNTYSKAYNMLVDLDKLLNDLGINHTSELIKIQQEIVQKRFESESKTVA